MVPPLLYFHFSLSNWSVENLEVKKKGALFRHEKKKLELSCGNKP